MGVCRWHCLPAASTTLDRLRSVRDIATAFDILQDRIERQIRFVLTARPSEPCMAQDESGHSLRVCELLLLAVFR